MDESEFIGSLEEFNNDVRPFSAKYQINYDNDDYYSTKKNLNEDRLYSRNETTMNYANDNDHHSNPLDDINNDDSLIKDLTKVRQFALSEIDHSQ